MELRIDENESEKMLIDKKIAIINPWKNKFTDLYFKYFQKNNNVQLVNPQSNKDLIQVIQWADLVWSQWSNEPLINISKQNFKATLVTHIHSYEILMPQLIKNVEWNRVDGIIFVSDHIRENANRLWSQEIKNVTQTTIYNSVDLSEYPFRYVLPGKNIGYVGYINHKKGVGLLLQCIKAIVDFDPEYNFHIAGSFQETRFEVYMRHMIEQMGIKDKIVFHGWVENIPDWLKTMNYIISTSPWEGCPMNVIEAMACGIKPLIHNWQGAKDLFPEKYVFNTVDECLSIIREKTYNSEEIRNVVEYSFNAERNVTMIERYLSDCMISHIKKQHQNSSKSVQLANPRTFDKPISKLEKERNCSVSETKKQAINFYQPLEKTVQLSSNRKDFTVDFCRGKNVLHIGCVDAGIMDERIQGNNFLHYQIGSVAKKTIGADIETKGLKKLASEGYEVYKINLENDIDLLKELAGRVDVIVIPEVIEHLNNVGKALDNIKSCSFKGDILLSTPNAFSFRTFKLIGKCVEMIHPDHNYYFSPTTLRTILYKHGFSVERLVMYYWPTNDLIGKELQKFVTNNPYYAEGMIAIVKDLSYKTDG
jgi:glycosyltransferase involved in cell wall biosynthesis